VINPTPIAPPVSSFGEQKWNAARSRIRAFDGGHNGLNAISSLAPRPATHPEGPLSALTVAVKDNIDVVGLPTTTGSLALEGAEPVRNADVVDALRDAGALLVAKTTQLELSGWVTFAAPAGYSALGGRPLNPHNPRLSTGGSSSGAAVAVAAGYVDVAIGTDTGGSILNPAGLNGVFGLRPTVGRVSVRGVVPISPRQDTPGPMSLSSRHLAATMSAIVHERADEFHSRLDDRRMESLTVGIPMLAGVSGEDLAHWRERLAHLRAAGAALVPLLEDLPWRGHGDLTVPTYDFRENIDPYLAGVRAPTGVDDFDSLVAHYLADPTARMPYGADNLLRSAKVDLERDRSHRDDVWQLERSGTRRTLERIHERFSVDVVLFPGGGAAYFSSKSGYPALTIPGAVGADGLMHFTTALATQPDAEQMLLDLAYGLEKNLGAPASAPLPEV
jgi:amidase